MKKSLEKILTTTAIGLGLVLTADGILKGLKTYQNLTDYSKKDKKY
tara:strand:- start:16 stop:153 length:138 start_codon:yes stop_codon:yes gene_type:complete